MLGEVSLESILPYGGLIVAVVVAAISGYFAVKGKRLDAGEWITNTLKNDAETNREELKEVKEEFLLHKERSEKEITLLKEAVATLIVKEKELLAYISLLEKEVNILKELLVLQGGATPDITFSLKSVDIPDSMTTQDIQGMIEEIKKGLNK